MTDTLQSLDLWAERNPLRKHRRLNKITLIRAARLIGVSVNTITKWEAGVSVPTASSSLERLQELIGRPIQPDWRKWLEDQPKVQPAANNSH